MSLNLRCKNIMLFETQTWAAECPTAIMVFEFQTYMFGSQIAKKNYVV